MSNPSPRQEAMNDLRAAQSLIERAMAALQAMPTIRKPAAVKQSGSPQMLGGNAQPEKANAEE